MSNDNNEPGVTYMTEVLMADLEGRATWWEAKAETYAAIIRSGEYGTVAEEHTHSSYGDRFPAFTMTDGRELQTNESGIFKDGVGISNTKLRDPEDFPDVPRRTLATERADQRSRMMACWKQGRPDLAKKHDAAIHELNDAIEKMGPSAGPE